LTAVSYRFFFSLSSTSAAFASSNDLRRREVEIIFSLELAGDLGFTGS
jgi:hypothetical protein